VAGENTYFTLQKTHPPLEDVHDGVVLPFRCVDGVVVMYACHNMTRAVVVRPATRFGALLLELHNAEQERDVA